VDQHRVQRHSGEERATQLKPLRGSAALQHEQALLRSDSNHHSTSHPSTSRDRRQDRDPVARGQRRIQSGPRADVVDVDKYVDVGPRLTALVAKAYVHLRVLPRELREQRADIVRKDAKLPTSYLRMAAAERPQRLRD